MKRIVILLIGISMLLVFSTAMAESDRTSGLFTYRLKGNGEAVITGFDWNDNGKNDIYVPRQIDGYTVSEIGAYAFSSSEVGYVFTDLGHDRKSIACNMVLV